MTASARPAPEDSGAERETFAAYVVDASAQSAARTLAERRGWSASSIRRGGLPSALRLLAVAPPARLMIVDVDGLPDDEIAQGLAELSRLGATVLALGSINDVAFFRHVIRSGARDYLVKPVDADMLGEVFVRFEAPADEPGSGARAVGLIGARGGVGVTTLAINIAWLMAETLSRRTALVDMDIYAGTIALALDMEPTRGLREAFEDPARVDAVFLGNAMARFGRHLHVLATEEALTDTVPMSDEKVLAIAEAVAAGFDMAVLDLPRHFALREPQLFSRLQDVVIVSDLTLQGLRDCNRLVKLLSFRNPATRIHVVANRVPARPEVTVNEFETGLEQKLRCVLPLDAKATARAGFRGRPLAAGEPRHRLVQGLSGLAKEMAGVPEERRRGFTLFRRRAAKG